MNKLTEQTVVHIIGRCGEMARVMNMVDTLHAVDVRAGHDLMAVESCRQQHRYEYRQQEPCNTNPSTLFVHFACKVTIKRAEYKEKLLFFNLFSSESNLSKVSNTSLMFLLVYDLLTEKRAESVQVFPTLQFI